MYDEKEFDEYSNFDDRDIQHSQAAPKMGRTNKEEYGMEKNTDILNSKKSSYTNKKNS
ncbi:MULTISPECIES: hypothetical protein [Lysinibacillus]|uniref:hypothetical protein n=1 Tax=Lysinibacillus TaxID=400634 RepID=UPI001319D46F|nr:MULTISPECIES: hypothetical protein [Lysinibacillus]